VCARCRGDFEIVQYVWVAAGRHDYIPPDMHFHHPRRTGHNLRRCKSWGVEWERAHASLSVGSGREGPGPGLGPGPGPGLGPGPGPGAGSPAGTGGTGCSSGVRGYHPGQTLAVRRRGQSTLPIHTCNIGPIFYAGKAELLRHKLGKNGIYCGCLCGIQHTKPFRNLKREENNHVNNNVVKTSIGSCMGLWPTSPLQCPPPLPPLDSQPPPPLPPGVSQANAHGPRARPKGVPRGPRGRQRGRRGVKAAGAPADIHGGCLYAWIITEKKITEPQIQNHTKEIEGAC